MIIAPRVCQGGRRPPGAAAPPHLSRRGRGLPAPHPRNGCPLRGGGGGELRPAGETGLAAGLGGIGRVRALGLLRGPGVRCGAARGGGGFGDLPFLRWGGPCRQAQPRERAGVPETRPAPPPQRVSSPQRRGRAAFRRDSRCSRASLAAAQPSLRRRAPLSPRAAAAWLSFLSSTVTGRG